MIKFDWANSPKHPPPQQKDGSFAPGRRKPTVPLLNLHTNFNAKCRKFLQKDAMLDFSDLFLVFILVLLICTTLIPHYAITSNQ